MILTHIIAGFLLVGIYREINTSLDIQYKLNIDYNHQ